MNEDLRKILLAQYMGLEPVVADKEGKNVYYIDKTTSTGTAYTLKGLNYDSSWDWIMDVIKKLKNVNIAIDTKEEKASVFGGGYRFESPIIDGNILKALFYAVSDYIYFIKTNSK